MFRQHAWYGNRWFIFSKLYIFQDSFNTISVSSHLHSANPEGTQVIVGSMNMGYDIILSDTARNRTHNLFRPKCAQIPLGHSPRIAYSLTATRCSPDCDCVASMHTVSQPSPLASWYQYLHYLVSRNTGLYKYMCLFTIIASQKVGSLTPGPSRSGASLNLTTRLYCSPDDIYQGGQNYHPMVLTKGRKISEITAVFLGVMCVCFCCWPIMNIEVSSAKHKI